MGGGGVQQVVLTPYVASPSYNFVPPVVGAIVDVTLQIERHAVITRNAFNATLYLNNTAGAQITDLQVTLNPVDGSGNSVSNLFEVEPPLPSGLNRRQLHRQPRSTNTTMSWNQAGAGAAVHGGGECFGQVIRASRPLS